MAKKRIILFSPLPPPMGGMARWTEYYLNYMNGDENIEVNLINSAIHADGLNSNGIFAEIKREFYIFRRIIALENNDNTIFHLNSSGNKYGIVRDYLITRILNFKKIKYIVHFHCDLTEQGYGEMQTKFVRKMIISSNRTFVLNNSSYMFAKEYFDRVNLVNNFVDDKLIKKFKKTKQSEEINNICYIGRFSLEKGAKEFLSLAKMNKDIKFNIYGPIEYAYNQNEYDNVVSFGLIANSKLFEEVAKNDLFIFLSKQEGSPLSVIEAACLGIPILSTNVGNISKMLCEKSILINSNEEYVTNIIKKMSKNDRENMVQENEALSKDYCGSKVLPKMISLYDKIKYED